LPLAIIVGRLDPLSDDFRVALLPYPFLETQKLTIGRAQKCLTKESQIIVCVLEQTDVADLGIDGRNQLVGALGSLAKLRETAEFKHALGGDDVSLPRHAGTALVPKGSTTTCDRTVKLVVCESGSPQPDLAET
jgi:hypothetical protein